MNIKKGSPYRINMLFSELVFFGSDISHIHKYCEDYGEVINHDLKKNSKPLVNEYIFMLKLNNIMISIYLHLCHLMILYNFRSILMYEI